MKLQYLYEKISNEWTVEKFLNRIRHCLRKRNLY